MSFTRFHDDPCRIEKQLQESTGTGKYMLNVPGNGTKPCFMEDPFIRMQKWGANLQTNSINLESDLRGLTRGLNDDCIGVNEYTKNAVKSRRINYPKCAPITEQPRATHPAWTAKDLEQVNWYILPLDPQENVCIPFLNNLSTRILERDNFVPQGPCLKDDNPNISLNSDKFTGNKGGSGLCTASNLCNPY
tara:strand:- start:53 stop:625 length:573 start_codon:yes stop_codon:yes gene_type:complete